MLQMKDAVMTTKEQERKALEKIRKIVEELGENSYVGTAFEGCFEDAEENINNDFALSMNDRWQTAAQRVEELAEENSNLKVRIKNAEDQCMKAEDIANRYIGQYQEANDLSIQNWNKFREQEDRADALEKEIINLKAKLYDLMTAVKEG